MRLSLEIYQPYFLSFIDIEMPQTLISAQVKKNHYGYDPGRGYHRLDKPVIKFAKVIAHTENFSNFVY